MAHDETTGISQAIVLDWIRTCARLIATQRDYLTELDAAIGDADHGANLDRGFQAALGRLPSVVDKDVGTILKTVGMTLVSTVGGASGPLYGTFFLQLGSSTVGKQDLSPGEWVAAMKAGVDGVVARGKANLGDKTMIDALLPAVDALRSAVLAGASLAVATENAAAAAERGADATVPLVARKGRASYLGDRSAGHRDPGATSSTLLFQALVESVGRHR